MSLDYLLGKDMNSLQESIRRIDSRLDAIERSRKCTCADNVRLSTRVSRSPFIWSLGAQPTPTRENISAKPSGPPPFDWSATDESSTTRIQVGSDLFTLFAFMLDANKYAYTDPSTFSGVIFPYVEDLYNSDQSAVPSGYRPVGWQGRFCVLGIYSGTLGVWNFLAVQFCIAYQDDDSTVCCCSSTYGNDGNPVVGADGKTGWSPDVRLLMSPYYSLIHYADCDYEYGLSFGFGNLTRQQKLL
jgi:hypothetical protein